MNLAHATTAVKTGPKSMLSSKTKSKIEEWRPVIGFEEFYEVSSFGRVRSHDRVDTIGRRRHGRILKLHIGGNGYFYTWLFRLPRRKFSSVHVLVAKAFLPRPSGSECVNHIDGDKLNNNLSNLEWVTYARNIQHAFETGLMRPCRGENHYLARLTNEQCCEVFALWKSGISQKKLAHRFDVGLGTIRRALKRAA